MTKKMIIIGGSSGIGLAIAKQATQQGMEVVIASRSQDKLDLALQTIHSELASAQPVDLTNQESLQKLFNTVGKFDYLVIPGSEVKVDKFQNQPIKDAQQTFNSKFWGPYQAIHVALPYLNPEGAITLFSGSASHKPKPGVEILTAVNAAVEGLAKALAVSLAPVRVNVVAPGVTDTPVYDNFTPDEKTAVMNSFTNNLLIKRVASADEVASMTLAITLNGYMTGTTTLINGGHHLS